ncbi:MAG: (Fe-S)-binding protein [Chloroflexaceae bacterium]|nr:(Fe-S)-binding protein [Chloroflexaceae bacterium]
MGGAGGNERDKPLLTLRFRGKDIPDDSIIAACVRCGLCLPSCPTYCETSLEASSPRGRISLMKAVSEGRIGLDSEVFQEQMYQCLNCRACEAVCPSGVAYGNILEASRAQVEQAREGSLLLPVPPGLQPLRPLPWWLRLLRRAVFGGLFFHLGWFRAFSHALALYQRSGIQAVARKSGLLRWMGMHDLEAMLPPMSRTFVIPQGQIYRAQGQLRFTVALLSGCIMSTAFAHVHEATVRVLQRNGCDIIIPPDQQCCGALHLHSGDLEGGRSLARRNIAAFEGLGVDAILVNAAGCGSTLKEYGDLLHGDLSWHQRARHFSNRVKDVHEFLANIGLNRADLGPLPLRVAYQEPCHLAHAQRITAEPRMLLRAIPRLHLREMRESALCCGSAGVYNITHPEMAQQLGSRKVSHALDTGAEVIATANPGCALQLAGELRRRGKAIAVRSIVELLDEAYQRG